MADHLIGPHWASGRWEMDGAALAFWEIPRWPEKGEIDVQTQNDGGKMQSPQCYTECYAAGTKKKERWVGLEVAGQGWPRTEGLRWSGITGRSQEGKRRTGRRRENTGNEKNDKTLRKTPQAKLQTKQHTKALIEKPHRKSWRRWKEKIKKLESSNWESEQGARRQTCSFFLSSFLAQLSFQLSFKHYPMLRFCNKSKIKSFTQLLDKKRKITTNPPPNTIILNFVPFTPVCIPSVHHLNLARISACRVLHFHIFISSQKCTWGKKKCRREEKEDHCRFY